jgi:hypothetical protein
MDESEIELGVKRFPPKRVYPFGHPHRNRRSVHIVLPSYSGGSAKILMHLKDLTQLLTCSDRSGHSAFLRKVSPREVTVTLNRGYREHPGGAPSLWVTQLPKGTLRVSVTNGL